MTKKDIIMARPEELKRLHIIRKIMEKEIIQAEAGEILELSERQIRRLVKKVRVEGDQGIIHKLRGNPSNRIISNKIKNKTLNLFQKKYHDFGPTLASEKLFEIDKIKVNDETLRLWLIENNITYKNRKKRPHRQWRERKQYSGEMIQVDGSHHDWFEGRGTKCVLMAYIDDATSNVFARFYEYEGTIPVMDSFKRYIKKYGIPHSLYLDKHTTYKSNGKLTIEDELAGKKLESQFERASRELEVKIIHANSPQAKGRIERLFKTMQDRLIKEMRLKNIKSIEEGNKFLESYLPIYNKKFSAEAAKLNDLHRAVSEKSDLDKMLCIKTDRVVRNDYTVSHNKKMYQIKENIKAKKVIVEEKINGQILIKYNDNSLKYKEINKITQKQNNEINLKPINRTYIPSINHPWKNPSYQNRINYLNNTL